MSKQILLILSVLASLTVVNSAPNAGIVYYFPLNFTTVKGVMKDTYCNDLASSSIQGTSPSTTQGPNATHGEPALKFASDNWANLGDFKDTCISNPSLCTNGMTVSFWLRMNSGDSGNRHIITTGKLDTSRGLQVFLSNGHTNVVLCDGNKRFPVEIAFPSTWTLVTAIYNPSGATAADNFYVYTNGSNKETALYKVNCGLDDKDTHLVLGHDTTSGSVSSRPFEITQLAFHYKILSQGDVQSMYNDAASGIALTCPVKPTTSATTTSSSGGGGSGGGGGGDGSGSSGSGSKQTGNDSDDGRSPVVLILLSVALFILLVIVIILIIACCVIYPNAKSKGYKCI